MDAMLSSTVRRAAKRHRCQLCWTLIEKGERYRDQRNVSDGSAYTWREHLRCADFVRATGWWDHYDEIDAPLFADLVADERDLAIRHGVPVAIEEEA